MNCREASQSFKTYLRGELSFPQRMDFHRHLAACEKCARSFEQARDAVDLSRSACAAAQDPVADDVPLELVQAILVTSRH